jgi:hypothetical protein
MAIVGAKFTNIQAVEKALLQAFGRKKMSMTSIGKSSFRTISGNMSE